MQLTSNEATCASKKRDFTCYQLEFILNCRAMQQGEIEEWWGGKECLRMLVSVLAEGQMPCGPQLFMVFTYGSLYSD